MQRITHWLVLLVALGAASSSRAQVPADAGGPAPLVLVGVVASDAPSTLASSVTERLGALAIARGYRIVPRAPGVAVPDLESGSGLAAIASASGAVRTLHVQVGGVAGARTLHVGVAGAFDVGAVALARTVTDDEQIASALEAMAREILPSPSEALTGEWATPMRTETRRDSRSDRAVVEGPARRVRVRVPVRPASPEPRTHVPVALIAGAAVLGGAWVLDIATGVFGGYHDRTCVDLGGLGGCSGSGGPAFDPAWSDFRALSLVPLAGPWVQLALLPDTNNLWPFWLVLDGLVQAGGLVALVAGVIDEATRAVESPTRPRVSAWLSAQVVGLAVSGSL